MLDKTTVIFIMLIWTLPVLVVLALMHKSMSQSFDRMEATATKRFEKIKDRLLKIGRG